MGRTFTILLVLGMVGGILAGFLIHQYADPATAKSLTDGLGIITTVFLRLIRMIIAPLVFSTLVAGIAHMEDAGAVGRGAARPLGCFIGAALLSLVIGLIMVHLLQPGAGLNLPLPNAAASV